MAMTREDLDRQGCGNPGCSHDHTILILQAGCHPRARTEIAYDKRTGVVRISCKVCQTTISEFAIARSELVH